MKLSDIIAYLNDFKLEHGNIKVYEATREYGSVEISTESIETFIRMESIKYKKEDVIEERLVIGRH